MKGSVSGSWACRNNDQQCDHFISFSPVRHLTSQETTQTRTHARAQPWDAAVAPIYFTPSATLNSLSKASQEGDKTNRITVTAGLHSIVKCIFIV